MADLKIIPILGSKGFYQFAAPFDKYSANPVEYTCQEVRRISGYLANNEDVKAEVYTANGIDSAWEADVAENAYIVSLQATTGHWVILPYRYITSYPSVNGVVYRSLSLVVSLPSMPGEQDLSALLADMKDMVDARLGVSCKAAPVETSKPMMVPYDTHVATQIERQASIQANGTLSSQLVQEREANAALRQKVQELEAYILNNQTP